jgi:hypothetical protein
MERAMIPKVLKVKLAITITVQKGTAPYVRQRDLAKTRIRPYKFEIIMFTQEHGREERGYVKVIGNTDDGYVRSTNFNIENTKHPEPPDWLVALITKELQ